MGSSNAIVFRRLAAEELIDRKMVYVSPNISRFVYEADEFLNGTVMFRDLLFEGDQVRVGEEIEEYVNQGLEEYTQFYRIVTREGEIRWVEDRTSVVDDAESGLRFHQGIVIDIHERKIIEDKLKKSEEKHRRVIETTSEGFLLLDNDSLTIDLNPAYEQMVGTSRDQLMGCLPSAISPDLRPFLDKLAEDDARVELEGELTDVSGKRVPILLHIGGLISDNGERLGATVFITDLSSQKKALQLAAEVQHSLLPLDPPTVPGLDVAGISISCDEVGGDFFDYIDGGTTNDGLTVVVGDISGHGVDAALLMTSARSYLKACSSQMQTPKEIVEAMNRHLVDDMTESGRFMTLFYLFISPNKKRIEWIRAGHDPALLYDPISDSFSELKGPGVALGIESSITYQTQQVMGLKKGQLIVIVTDGVWEAMSKGDEMFGKQRLREIVKERHRDDADSIIKEILLSHNDFTKGTQVADDLTVVVVKVD